jgi:hypothetical protein
MKILTTRSQLRHTLETAHRVIFEPGGQIGGGGSVGPTVTWDPATAITATLSNGNLTAANAATWYQGAFGTTTHTTGKWYFEITLTAADNSISNSYGWGAALDGTGLIDFSSGGVGGVICYLGSGGINAGGSGTGYGINASQGAIVGVAIDLTNQKMWFKIVAGTGSGGALWNGNGTANPATNVNGAAIPTAGAMRPLISFNTHNTTDIMTANFGASAFSGAAPSGFSAWGISTTFDPATLQNTALSGGNLVATLAFVDPAIQGVKATSSKTTGKYYFEITWPDLLSANNLDGGFGVCLPSATYTALNGGGTGGVIQYVTGNCFTNGSNSTHPIAGIRTGDVMAAAVDLNNRNVWFKCIAGSGTGVGWNGNLSYDPAANTGGTPILAGSILPFVSFGNDNAVGVDIATADFGATTFIGTVPTGFTAGWPI